MLANEHNAVESAVSYIVLYFVSEYSTKHYHFVSELSNTDYHFVSNVCFRNVCSVRISHTIYEAISRRDILVFGEPAVLLAVSLNDVSHIT